MGGSASTAPLFEYSYVQERAELRRQLIEQFEKNPQHRDLLYKITMLRSLLTQHTDICATAKEEARREEANALEGPTTSQSAFAEIDRLFTMYETSTILKSVQCRSIGNVACPLGHHAALFDDFRILCDANTKQSPVVCNICDKSCEKGYHCSYCAYSLCVPCSVIYCANGHAMTLWTHPEAQLHCFLCQTAITAGYRCAICHEREGEYDICDMCSYKPGRQAIQDVIHKRMAEDIQYIEDSQSESETALKTVSLHKKKVKDNLYPTTKHLYDFSIDLAEIREIVRQEVIQTRITRDIEAMRVELVMGKRFSKTAYEESLKTGNFTAEEQKRLRHLVDWSVYLKSFVVRCDHVIACPLAHAMTAFEGLPEQYLRRRCAAELQHGDGSEGAIVFTQRNKRNQSSEQLFTVICKICDRVASSGYHCDFCEYDLCHVCSKIYCAEGHRMLMWTEPFGRETCFLCKANPLTTGYRCRTCHVDLCDDCTYIEGRNKIRNNWHQEMLTLIAFMRENRLLSDVAMYYQWRHTNEIISAGFLIEYVRELREAKIRAERQIVQKPIIDKIKLMRTEVTKHADLCATAAREAARTENFVFSTKKKANEELLRLIQLVQDGLSLQTIDKRRVAGIACPLGHAMEEIQPRVRDVDESEEIEALAALHGSGVEDEQETRPETHLAIEDMEENPRDQADLRVVPLDEQLPTSPTRRQPANTQPTGSSTSSRVNVRPLPAPSSNKHELDQVRTEPLTASQQQFQQELRDTMNSVIAEFPDRHSPFAFDPFDGRTCRICATTNLYLGMTCTYCQYDLCVDCRVVYCRQGHPCKIWTLPEAETMHCEACKKTNITAGYRCVVCEIDICDMCTAQDSRNAYLLWPRRELHRIISHLENIANESITAGDYVSRLKADPDKSYLHIMSKLCKKLQELEEVRKIADEEVKNRLKTVKVRKYGLSNRDML